MPTYSLPSFPFNLCHASPPPRTLAVSWRLVSMSLFLSLVARLLYIAGHCHTWLWGWRWQDPPKCSIFIVDYTVMHYHIPEVFTAWVQFCVLQVHALSSCSCVTASELGCRMLLLCMLCKTVWQHFEHTGQVMKGDEYSGVTEYVVFVCGV
jgi:hypothetical protein